LIALSGSLGKSLGLLQKIFFKAFRTKTACFETPSKSFFDGNSKNFRKIAVAAKKNVPKSKNRPGSAVSCNGWALLASSALGFLMLQQR